MTGIQCLFDLSEVTYSYKGRQIALDCVSLKVWPGERVAMLGANGSGKSTLLKIMDGLYFPEEGKVRFYGKDLSEQAFRDDEFHYDFRRKVGLVFQDSDVQLFCPSVWDEVAFAPLQIGLSQEMVAGRVNEALEALNIAELADRAPHHLSGGEKKRVALASVLSLDPEVWLLDEPTAGLDPHTIYWLEEFIDMEGIQGKTVLFTTHDLELVRALATRVIVFNTNHRLVAEGNPDEILTNDELLYDCNLVHQHWHRHTDQGIMIHHAPKFKKSVMGR